ncbi:MAG: oligoendopeptidase F [Candidatus Zixiibacteriota bacterium]|nr:MAG: oligoendopeptidase F [candidate division Zixibacteria bacterium]
MGQSGGITPRSEIDDEYKWDLNHIYPDWGTWEAGLKDLEKLMDDYAALKGSLAGGPDNLYKAYKMSDDLTALLFRVYRYPDLHLVLDNANNEYSAKLQQVQLLMAKFGTATSWFNPELLSIPWDTMKEWLDENEKLTPYRFGIENAYRLQEHVLDEEKEKLLSYYSTFSGTPSSIYNDLSTSDIKYEDVALSTGETVTMTEGKYSNTLATNYNQDDRRLAFRTLYGVYHANRNTYASIYNSIMQSNWAEAQARNYGSCIEAALNPNNIPVKVVELLIDAVKNGYEPLQRYHKLRAKTLGLEEYYGYDGRIPLIELDKTYDYELAKKWTYESVEPLGKEYREVVKQSLENRWIDVYEAQGKYSGAFSANVYGVHPYMLLNYNNTLTSVFTLAHEVAHCCHTWLSNENQPTATSGYTIFVAEVASAINEALLLDYLMERSTDPKERIEMLLMAIQDLEGTFYLQTQFADYELQAHRLVEQSQPITADVLTKISFDLERAASGDSRAVDSLYGSIWCRISHFYDAPFYVYQYASCYAAAAKLLEEIRSEDKEVREQALDKYMTLLKSGGNDYPAEQLRKAGIDMTDPETYTAVIRHMDRLVTQLEEEMAKL